MITLTEKSFLQPTLSLYLGGSGILAGDRLLAIRESLPEEQRSLIEPFFIDSQEPALRDHARSRHYCYGNLGVFSEPIYEEFSARRFPENLGVSPVINSCEGCGVTRIFGAASLVACRDDFMELVDQSVARLKNKRQSATQPLQVFLTASACGGTGAGMIIDAAALLRYFFRERGENPRIFMFLVGPTVFFEDTSISMREDQKDRMRASTYALLKELHHFAQGKPFVSSYRLRDRWITIGNERDDDRLFDWVYFVDGRPEKGATRSLAEVAWTLAEAQTHLFVSEVGRKVAESMPNQREERVREYPLHFVHDDNKWRLSKEGRARLELSSRKTFLASLGVRNVRFPAEEIKTWLRWGWVREALKKSLRRGDEGQDKALIDQFDALLGFHRGNVEPDGLFANLGLTRDQLLLRVENDADPTEGLPAPLNPALNPDRAPVVAGELLAAAEAMIEEMKRHSSLLAAGTGPESRSTTSPASLVADALPPWRTAWAVGLAAGGSIAERLWQLAWSRADGRGLQFLDKLLAYTAALLTRLAAERDLPTSLKDLEDQLELARDRVTGLTRSRDRERKSKLRMFWRRSIARMTDSPIDSQRLRTSARTLVMDVNRFRNELIEYRRAEMTRALAPAAWLDAAMALKRWRSEVLAPAMTAAENAFTLADNRFELARQALTRHQGENTRGRWEAHTTVQIADDELLTSLSAGLNDVIVEDLVLVPLQHDGISREQHRLTIHNFAELDRESIVGLLFAHVEKSTRGKLAFLDNGWMLPEVRERLASSAAQALDLGAEPLLSFSRAAVGQPLQSYLLAPPTLIKPVPFGQRLGRMTKLDSVDPLQIGVVSFVYGIPPNSLEGIEDLFQQYAIHLGDQDRYKMQQDRYPLHVFRDAPENFDEPHSPPIFRLNDELAQSLLDAARELWANNGGIHLDIRQLDPNSTTLDWNRFIELTEKMLRHLVRSDEAARQLFRDGRFPDLKRLYDSRKYRAPETAGGNGHAKEQKGDQRKQRRPPADGDGETQQSAGEAGGPVGGSGDKSQEDGSKSEQS